MQSTRVRLLAWVLVPVLMVLSLTLMTAWFMLTNQQQQSIDAHLTREANELEILASKAINPATDELFKSAEGVLALYIQRTVPDPNETMFVIVNGKVHSRTTDVPAVRLDQDSEFIEIVNGVERAGLGNFPTEVGNARFIVVPVAGVSDSGALVGVIFSDLESADIRNLLSRFALIVFFALVAAVAVGWLVTGKALRPINQISNAANEINANDLSRRIETSAAGTEINELVAEFNMMLDRIEETFAANKQFVDDAGHELRTPLTVITGHLELIEADPSQRDNSMRIVKDELSRMSRIVKDLQTLTKLSQPDFVVMADVNLRDLGDELFVKASQLAELNWQLGEITETIVLLDRERITQAVLQLCENASRFTTLQDTILIDIDSSESFVDVSVSDSGPGIPLEMRENIKKRFVRGARGNSDSSGAGLGLAVVTAIAQGHGGEILIEDSSLGGARLVIRVPRRS
jgi:two-component system, OmpR family, sensor kinase